MEDLALLVSGIVIGLFMLGIAAVVLAGMSRKNKVSKFWALGAAIFLSIVALIAWQGSDRLALIPLSWAILAGVIAMWPKAKK